MLNLFLLLAFVVSLHRLLVSRFRLFDWLELIVALHSRGRYCRAVAPPSDEILQPVRDGQQPSGAYP